MASALVEQYRALPAEGGTKEDQEVILKFLTRILSYFREFSIMKVKVDFWVFLTEEEREKFLGQVFQAYKDIENIPRPLVLDFFRDLISIAAPDIRYKIILLLTQVIRDESPNLVLHLVRFIRGFFQLIENEFHGQVWDLVNYGFERKEDILGEELVFELDNSRPWFSPHDEETYRRVLLEQFLEKKPWSKATLKAVLNYIEEKADPVDPEFAKKLVEALDKPSFKGQDEKVYLLLVEEKILRFLETKQRGKFIGQIGKIFQNPDSLDYLTDLFQILTRLWFELYPEEREKFLKKNWEKLARYLKDEHALREDARDALETLIEKIWDDIAADSDRVDKFYQ